MRNARPVAFAVLAAALALVLLGALEPFAVAPAQARPEKKKKLTLRQWKKKMNQWAREIGKKCIYCHVKEGEEFDYEADTPKKAIADYCNEHFVEKLLTEKKKPVTCGTCHDQKATFLPREGGAEDPPADEDPADEADDQEG